MGLHQPWERVGALHVHVLTWNTHQAHEVKKPEQSSMWGLEAPRDVQTLALPPQETERTLR